MKICEGIINELSYDIPSREGSLKSGGGKRDPALSINVENSIQKPAGLSRGLVIYYY